MSNNADPDGTVPLNSSDDIDLETLALLAADDRVIAEDKATLDAQYAPESGRLGVVTDTDTVYVGDGSAWVTTVGVSSPAVDTERMSVTPQDLSSLSLGSEDDGDLYYHDGNSSITADGSSTSDAGYYRWDNGASEWAKVEGGGGGGDYTDGDGTQRTFYFRDSQPTLNSGDVWFET